MEGRSSVGYGLGVGQKVNGGIENQVLLVNLDANLHRKVHQLERLVGLSSTSIGLDIVRLWPTKLFANLYRPKSFVNRRYM
jgi:hypothetical protein